MLTFSLLLTSISNLNPEVFIVFVINIVLLKVEIRASVSFPIYQLLKQRF